MCCYKSSWRAHVFIFILSNCLRALLPCTVRLQILQGVAASGSNMCLSLTYSLGCIPTLSHKQVLQGEAAAESKPFSLPHTANHGTSQDSIHSVLCINWHAPNLSRLQILQGVAVAMRRAGWGRARCLQLCSDTRLAGLVGWCAFLSGLFSSGLGQKFGFANFHAF